MRSLFSKIYGFFLTFASSVAGAVRGKFFKTYGFLLAHPAVTVGLTAAVVSVLFTPHAAFAAWDPEQGAQKVLEFIRFLIIIGAAVMAGMSMVRHEIVKAVIAMVVGALLYVGLDKSAMETIGNGIKNLLQIGGGGGQ